MIKAIIFDLDGTLLNTLDDLHQSTNYALEKFGCEKITLEQTRRFVGNGVKKLVQRALPKDFSQNNFEEGLKVFKEHYAKNMYNSTAPYGGIVELLKNLKEKGIKIGVASNKFDTAVNELCEKYFPNLIDTAVGESEKIPKKPEPDSVFEVMKQFETNKEETLYVGDSEVDCQTAKNAGLKCIGVSWGFREVEVLRKEGANYIVNRPDEILNILEKFSS